MSVPIAIFIIPAILFIQIVYIFNSSLEPQCTYLIQPEEPNTEFSSVVPEDPPTTQQRQQPHLENLSLCQSPAEIGAALEILGSRNESRRAIFFIESSNKGSITARQICALESAAMHNPDADIYLLLLDPPENPDLTRDEKMLTVLRHHDNVRLLAADSATYYVGTPLQEWSVANRINTSSHPIEHASDIMRVVTLLRYGGVYLDLDFVILQSLATLPPNWLSYELNRDLCNGALGFQKGHPMAQMMAHELAETFDGSSWAHNGPSMVARVMSRMCGMPESESGNNCSDVTVLERDKLFPIGYPGWERYFDGAAGPEVVDSVKHSLGVHVFNYLSHGANVTLGSNQAYSLLAQKHCPRAYWGCFKFF